MSEALPPDLEQFVKQAVASGEYTTEDDVVIAAVRAFRELNERHAALRDDIQQGIDALDAGHGRPWDSEEMVRKLNEGPGPSPTTA